jgi:hypothetical protein
MLFLTCLEGIIAFVFLFASPSEAKNAWLFGYSKGRVLSGGIMLALLLLIVAITIVLFIRNDWLTNSVRTFEKFLIKGENYGFVLISIASLLIGCVALLLVRYLAADYLGMFAVVIERVKAVIFCGIAILIQLIGLLQIFKCKASPKPQSITPAMLGKSLLVSGIIVPSIVHWIILYFRLPVFLEIQNWFWNFDTKTDLYFEWLFVIMVGVAVIAAAYYLKIPRRPQWRLVFLIILGVFIQAGFGFIEGKGFESLRANYTDTLHRVYAELASDDPDLLSTVTEYESLYAGNIFTGTKPPGVMLVYEATEKLSNALFPEDTFQGRFDHLTKVITYVFPLLSFLVIIPLYFFSRTFLGEEDAILPAILYLFTPNILLIPLFLDQVLYPMVLLLCIFIVSAAIKRCSYRLSFLAGCLLYLAVFLTFSMIPTIFMAFLMAGLYFLFFIRQTTPPRSAPLMPDRLKMIACISLSMLAGMLTLFMAFRWLFHYDPFIRFENAMAAHQMIKSFDSSLPQLLNNLLVNNLDYGSWIGFPLALFGLVALVITIRRLVTRKTDLIDWLAISFLITYLMLNFSGQTQNETGRLWMFFNPLVVILASSVIAKTFHRKRFIVSLFIVCQLVTTYMIFVFQDFRA